jgi:AraC-like DNA-binding protein
MTTLRAERFSDSPLVEKVAEINYGEATREWLTPDGRWELVVMRSSAGTMVFQTGLLSRPLQLDYAAGDSLLAISFKPGVFVPRAPGIEMLDRALERPLVGARAFAMDGETLEIPTFENADMLVHRLVRKGLLVRDELVEGATSGDLRAISQRSIQRHFLLATGMTPKQFEQVQRACRAVDLLRSGMAPAAVALEAGYSDQPHLTRALKSIIGQTPAAMVRASKGADR